MAATPHHVPDVTSSGLASPADLRRSPSQASDWRLVSDLGDACLNCLFQIEGILLARAHADAQTNADERPFWLVHRECADVERYYHILDIWHKDVATALPTDPPSDVGHELGEPDMLQRSRMSFLSELGSLILSKSHFRTWNVSSSQGRKQLQCICPTPKTRSRPSSYETAAIDSRQR